MPRFNREADILYIPAVHQGYVDYLSRRTGPVGIIDEKLVREVPRLDRDIRALSSLVVPGLVQIVAPTRRATIISGRQDIHDIYGWNDAVVMPDEDVSHAVYEEHIAPLGYSVRFENCFLRWDRMRSLQQETVDPHIVISEEELDVLFLEEAKQLGLNSPDWWRQVGCVIARDGEIIAKGYNAPYPTKNYTLETFGDPRSNFDAGERIDLQKCIHAEVGVIASAAREGVSLKDSTIFVSTFPCPVCARAICEAGVSRVVYEEGYSLLDALDLFKAKDIEIVKVIAKVQPTLASTTGESDSPFPETT